MTVGDVKKVLNQKRYDDAMHDTRYNSMFFRNEKNTGCYFSEITM